MKKHIVFFALFLFILASCTVQKRYHNSGFHISWLGGDKTTEIKKQDKKNKKEAAANQQESTKDQHEDIAAVTETNPHQDIEKTGKETESLETMNSNTSPFKRKNNSTHHTNSVVEYQNEKASSSKPATTLNTHKRKGTKDTLQFLMFAAMGLVTFGLMKGSKTTGDKITKWARSNPFKAQVGITGLQVALSGLGLYSGYNLHKMGIDFSYENLYLFAGIAGSGFLVSPLLPSKSIVKIPSKIFKNKLGYMGIALASFLAMNTIGNNLHSRYEGSFVTETVASFDQKVFGEENAKLESGNAAKRSGASAGMIVLAVLAILVLLTTLCAGICMALLAEKFLFVIGGAIIAGLSILGIVSIVLWLANSSSASKP